MVTTIPSFYRLFFSWVDPIMACPGAAMDFVAPHLFLESLAGPTVPYDSNTIALFHHLGGLYFMVAFLSAVLPRVSADLKVWKALQAGILIVDMASLSGSYATLERQGRLPPSDWRFNDWQWVVVTGLLAVIRACFLAEVGFGGKPAASKKRA